MTTGEIEELLEKLSRFESMAIDDIGSVREAIWTLGDIVGEILEEFKRQNKG